MTICLGMGSAGLANMGVCSLAAQIKSLFSNGEQGAWYEPSLTNGTLFQGSAGTTPVTAVGQPVGLMLDKRLGLVLGPELFAGLVTGSWSALAGSVITSENKYFTSSTSGPIKTGLFQIGKTYRVDYDISIDTASVVRFQNQDVGGAGSVIQQTAAGGSSGSFYITAAYQGLFFRSSTAGTANITINRLSVREIPGNHAVQPTSVNRPVLQQDAGGRFYLAFNGTNSWMSTGSIDFSAGDKMTIVAGVRKLSDAATGAVAELSAASGSSAFAGSFILSAPSSSGANSYRFVSEGTLGFFGVAGSGIFAAAPDTSVVAGLGSISGDIATMRRNRTVIQTSTADQGTGNYGSYPLYIGARAGTSLFFNGQIYSLVIRGALSSDSQILALERFANQRTGAF